MKEEIWKDIINHENYQISSYGRVKRKETLLKIPKNRNQKEDSIRRIKEKILQLCMDEDGYLIVSLDQKTYRVSVIVANHFLNKPKDAKRVRYKNKNIQDNNVDNLYWDCFLTKEEKNKRLNERSRKNNTRPKRRAWYKRREKKEEYIAYLRDPKRRYNIQKNSIAKKRGLDFTLELNEYIDLIKNPCYYCNKDLMIETGISLDRIDNDKGYISGNVLPCCGVCNKIRGRNLSVQEMKVAMNSVLEFRKTKEN